MGKGESLAGGSLPDYNTVVKLLALDIGNSNLSVGLFEEERLLTTWRLATDRHRTADEYGALLTILIQQAGIPPAQIGGVAVCNVVPPLNPTLHTLLQRYFPAPLLCVDHNTETGLRIAYETPADLGPDRMVNAAAAFHLFGGPCIVVDFGTATTFDVVTASGEFLGGAIAPGIGISLEALFTHAARLPRIELAPPPRAIGRTTRESMQSGILFGFAGQADALIERLWSELGTQTLVIATGGFAPLLAPHTQRIREVRPHLTLEGLALLWRRCVGGSPRFS